VKKKTYGILSKSIHRLSITISLKLWVDSASTDFAKKIELSSIIELVWANAGVSLPCENVMKKS
tara:strand:+ start:2813 stop:3004 length:192 start_codon:yes stop_codon:yes gene_type:complete